MICSLIPSFEELLREEAVGFILNPNLGLLGLGRSVWGFRPWQQYSRLWDLGLVFGAVGLRDF